MVLMLWGLSREELQPTRMVPLLRHLDYESRLKGLHLPTLTYRPLGGDVINVYKYLHGIFTLSHDVFKHDI